MNPEHTFSSIGKEMVNLTDCSDDSEKDEDGSGCGHEGEGGY